MAASLGVTTNTCKEIEYGPPIFLAGVALISVIISSVIAEASEAPWCAVISWGDGDTHWDCRYRSIEECRPKVIAGNRGFCNPNPYYVANPTELTNSRQTSQMGLKTTAKSEKALAMKKESPQDRRNASTPTKFVASPITVKTPQQPDDKSNALSKNSVATKSETLQPSQSDDKSNAETKNSVTTKMETLKSSESDGKSIGEVNMKSIAAKPDTSQSSQLDDESAITKAKVTIAAKMENPASVVFLEMKRAVREDARGNSIDTICGRVRGKLAGDTGERPFVYVVQKDEAYIGAYVLATTEYRKVCN
jgi:hypothetical protein